MRIRVLQTIYYDGKKHYEQGQIVDAPDAKATPWLKSGLAMQDKSLDGPGETKAEVPSQAAPLYVSEKKLKGKKK